MMTSALIKITKDYTLLTSQNAEEYTTTVE